MRLFKLFVLSLAALPSLVVGMELVPYSRQNVASLPLTGLGAKSDTVICDGKEFDLSEIKFEEHKDSLKQCVAAGALNKKDLDYILDPKRAKNIVSCKLRRGMDIRAGKLFYKVEGAIIFCRIKDARYPFCKYYTAPFGGKVLPQLLSGDPVLSLLSSNSRLPFKPWYLRSPMIGAGMLAAAAVGLGYYYRDSLAQA